MLRQFPLFSLFFILLDLARATAGEVLYNGIALPETWPPPRSMEEIVRREPQRIPYLEQPPRVIPIDVGRQLFVDDFLIESTTLTRVHHQPQFYAGNPVLKPETPAEHEGAGPMAMPFSDGAWFDPADQLFKLWYMCGYGRQTALATSRDGLLWERPDFKIKPGTNVVQFRGRDSSTVWLDHEEADPARRYKMMRGYFAGNVFGLTLHFSPDGIRWSPDISRTGSMGDRSTVFYNPFRHVWVYSLRSGWKNPPRFRRYWEVKDLLTGPHFQADTEAAPWLAADTLDAPREDLQTTPQLYNFDSVAYESLMVGFFTIWHGEANTPPGRPKPNNVCLGYSRDGFHYDRPDRRPFFPLSETKGAWNWGNVQSVGGGLLVVKDELWFYFSGRAGGAKPDDATGGTSKERDSGGATGLATLRRDGFASMRATPGHPGTLTTRPLTFSGQHLFVNAAPGPGALTAEVLDEAGQVIAPFSADQCEPVKTDSTRVELRWKGSADLASLAGKPVRLRFHLTAGDFYAFWVSPAPSGVSRGYVAAGGPGFANARDE